MLNELIKVKNITESPLIYTVNYNPGESLLVIRHY